jgi:hypothetical protein
MLTSFLLVIAYIQTGFQLGRRTEKVWKDKDPDSLEGFFFFPVSHFRGKVGEGSCPPPFGTGDATSYRVCMTMFWPLFLAWNALVIGGLLGPDKIIRRLFQNKEQLMLERMSRLDKQIARLEAADERALNAKFREIEAASAPALPAADAAAAPPPRKRPRRIRGRKADRERTVPDANDRDPPDPPTAAAAVVH